MPLIHSKKPAAFKKNIRAEVHAGKPVKQAVAIAYSVKRKAEHHKAHGGEMEDCPLCMDDGGQVTDQSGAESFQEGFRKATHYSEGGQTAANEKEPYKLADGGEMNMYEPGFAEGGEAEASPDDELHDLLGQEIMEAVHSKDHKRLMSGIEAMVLKCMNKGEDND
jgi:hypothetical protein